jgi:thiol-disulfide isomerase/thioredoxin
MFDKDGNLIQSITMAFGASHEGFTGAEGTFYFDERINLAKGRIKINEKNYAIGLYDYNINGLFNNEKDLLLVDINNDGKLESTRDAFRLNDVFELEGKHFKLDFIDPYGRNMILIETNEESTLYYLKEFQTQTIKGVTKGNLDSSFWSLEYKTITGNNVNMNIFKGKYLLLNFWGEWCGPCLAEIPGLIEGYKKFPRKKLEIISFLNTSKLEKAKKVIKEKGMLWPQIKITDWIDEKFRVQGWPTNILIYPDGINYLQIGSIYRTFFDEYIK